jgi:hypothetical protein
MPHPAAETEMSPAANSDFEARSFPVTRDFCGLEGDEPATGRALSPEPLMSLAVAALIALQRQRRFCIVAQMRSDRATESFLVNLMAPGLERRAAFKEARRLRRAIEAGNAPHPAASLVLRAQESRKGWDQFRADIEKRMRERARSLPVYDAFVKDTLGFSDLGLAIIVAEAGDLSGYGGPAKLWKRLGLAVMDGIRQGGLSKAAPAEAWIAHGYSPKRRAEVWNLLSDAMLKHQWQRGVARGPYGDAYARKKAEYLAREWTPQHADDAARRYMSKCFLRDLWRAWRQAVGNVVPTGESHFLFFHIE